MKYTIEEKVANVSTIETFEADTADEIIELKDKIERTEKCGLNKKHIPNIP